MAKLPRGLEAYPGWRSPAAQSRLSINTTPRKGTRIKKGR